jgi:hypothetical protein
MQKHKTALTAKALPLEERKARLAALVSAGKISAKAAKLIDLREPTERELAYGRTLAPKAREFLARKKRAVA